MANLSNTKHVGWVQDPREKINVHQVLDIHEVTMTACDILWKDSDTNDKVVLELCWAYSLLFCVFLQGPTRRVNTVGDDPSWTCRVSLIVAVSKKKSNLKNKTPIRV